jgi:putative holliday junction resolvase
MGRILAIDYGKKRVGIAVTDELKIIASSLETVNTSEIIPFLKKYTAKENLETIVVGEPKQMDYTDSESAQIIEEFIKKLKTALPEIPVVRADERFTSKIASQVISKSGLKKKERQNKALIDSISATLILQTYLETVSSSRFIHNI